MARGSWIAGCALIFAASPLAGQEPLIFHSPAQVRTPLHVARAVKVASCPAADSVFGKPRTFDAGLLRGTHDSATTFIVATGPSFITDPGDGIQFVTGTVSYTGASTPTPVYELIVSLRERQPLAIEARQLSLAVDDDPPIDIGSMSMHADSSPLTSGALMINLYAVLPTGTFRRLAAAHKVVMLLGPDRRKLDSRERDQIAAAYAAAVCGLPAN
jgi:hypothetical protein